jgi:hypothetical protein
VLGSVSMLVTDAMQGRAGRELLAFGSALGGLIMIGSIWIVWVSLNVRA